MCSIFTGFLLHILRTNKRTGYKILKGVQAHTNNDVVEYLYDLINQFCSFLFCELKNFFFS